MTTGRGWQTSLKGLYVYRKGDDGLHFICYTSGEGDYRLPPRQRGVGRLELDSAAYLKGVGN